VAAGRWVMEYMWTKRKKKKEKRKQKTKKKTKKKTKNKKEKKKENKKQKKTKNKKKNVNEILNGRVVVLTYTLASPPGRKWGGAASDQILWDEGGNRPLIILTLTMRIDCLFCRRVASGSGY
jgi:uncharacterized membrane protein